MAIADDAVTLWELGFQPVPAGDDKRPARRWKEYQTERVSKNRVRAWFSSVRAENVCVVTGAVSRLLILDVDDEATDQYWRSRIGDDMDRTVCVRSPSGNHHYWFRLGDDEQVRSWAIHDDELDFDVKAEGSIALTPPSHGYTWVRAPWEVDLVDAPAVVKGRGQELSGRGSGGSDGQARSMLSHLLTNPPAGDGSGRNSWLVRVAGHYAKQFRHARDAYDYHLDQAAALLTPPLPDREVAKLRESIWTSEQAKPDAVASDDNGWLVSRDGRLHVLTAAKVDDTWVESLEPWCDFDIECIGVVDDPDAARIYRVVLTRVRDQAQRELDLPADVLADTRRLNEWLAQSGVTVAEPGNAQPRGVRPPVRLQRFLESREAPRFRVTESLGWHDAAGGFVTDQGVITADGLQPLDGWRPPTWASAIAPHRYGWADVEETRRVLREVLTFHHEVVAAVFGSWWISTLIKPQLMKRTSLFPIMALEAPSESGKTTGMFSMLVELAGNKARQTVPTRAAARDAMAAHRSGIVWIDDPDDLESYYDLLRAATGEGTMIKKGEDRTTNVEAHLVAPVMISGEGLGVTHEKALRDRTITLGVPSPTGRRSLKADDGRLQWDDIVDFREAHPDLTEYSGTLVSMVLARADLAREVSRFRAAVGRRFGDKMAILRVGARLLAEVTGQRKWPDVVDRWVDEAVVHESWDNALTLRILPRALAVLGFPDEPRESARDDRPHTPVFVGPRESPHEGLWVSPVALAEWWRQLNHGRVNVRTDTEEAIRHQLDAMHSTESKRIKVRDEFGRVPDGSRRPISTFRKVPDDIAREVVARAQGVAGGVQRGPATSAEDSEEQSEEYSPQLSLKDRIKPPSDQAASQ